MTGDGPQAAVPCLWHHRCALCPWEIHTVALVPGQLLTLIHIGRFHAEQIGPVIPRPLDVAMADWLDRFAQWKANQSSN